MTRVEIPVYTDRWMMGDRFGTITKISKTRKAQLDEDRREIAHVKLDISGKTVRVYLEYCRVL